MVLSYLTANCNFNVELASYVVAMHEPVYLPMDTWFLNGEIKSKLYSYAVVSYYNVSTYNNA